MLLNIQLIIKSSFQCTFMAGTGMCLSVNELSQKFNNVNCDFHCLVQQQINSKHFQIYNIP